MIYLGDTVKVSYDESKDVILWKPAGAVDLDDWEKSFTLGIDYILQNDSGRTAWVNDCTDLKCVGGGVIQWLDTYVNERIINGLGRPVKVAFVVGEDNNIALAAIHAYISLTKLNHGLDERYAPHKVISIGVFHSMPDLWHWLRG